MRSIVSPTVADRQASGRAARTAVPRSSQSALELPAGRDPIAVLEAQNATRVPELVPIRYGRMLASPLAFLRGGAAVMANDLAGAASSGLRVQLCGDAHLLNFGGFATPERNLVFDVNDFDETLPGPFEWDVKRLAVSVEVAGRQRSFSRQVDGSSRLVSEPPLFVPLAELSDAEAVEALVHEGYRGYRRSLEPDRRLLIDRFRYGDAARKVVGVGSVGTRCWMLLLFGRDAKEPLFLQMKEAGPSVLGSSGSANHGKRVVQGQRLMQASSDIFLGWVRLQDPDGEQRDYYLRQLRDWKVTADLEAILPRGLTYYATACGWALARAHARSGDRIAIATYLGASDRFDRAIAAFATAYADVNERDHAALVQAAADSRIEAKENV